MGTAAGYIWGLLPVAGGQGCLRSLMDGRWPALRARGKGAWWPDARPAWVEFASKDIYFGGL